MRNPRRLMALAASAMLAASMAACGSSSDDGTASSTPKITLGLIQAQDFVHAMPARVAAAQGFFKNEGLDVKIVGFSAGSAMTKAMAGGSVQVGAATGLDAVSASAHGIDLQAFFGILQASPMALIVPKDSTVKGFADLKGKKVGISAAGSLTDYITRAALTKSGVPFADVTEVPLGAPDSTMTAMKRGDIDGFVLPVNFGFIEAAQGQGKVAQKASDVLGTDSQFAILMAKKSYISANTATLKKLAAAYTDAITWMQANKDATVQLAVSKLGMKQGIAEQTYDALATGMTPNGNINTAGMADYAKALPALKIATTSPEPDAYLSTKIVAGN